MGGGVGMSELRLVNANDDNIFRLDPNGYAGRMYACGWNGMVHVIKELPTIDPETLPIVRELREKLARYEQAEAEGQLVELPCKNWMEIVFGEQSIFYMIDTDYIEHPIREITVNNEERFSWYDGWETVYLMGYDENGNYIEFSPEHIGKIIFLTYEEAQAALQRGGPVNR